MFFNVLKFLTNSCDQSPLESVENGGLYIDGQMLCHACVRTNNKSSIAFRLRRLYAYANCGITWNLLLKVLY